jgi:PAS domain S-box-containing protein
LSALALEPTEPAAICEEALSVLFGNVHACAAGLIVETRAAGGFDVIASRGLGLDALGALSRMGDAAVLLDSVAERACIVSQSGDRAAWDVAAGTGSHSSRPVRRHPRAAAVARGVGCPILVEGRVLGVVALYGRHAGVDDPEYHPFLQAVSNVLASALARQRTRRRLALELEVSRVLAGAASLDSASEGLLPALHTALRVDEVELWAAGGAESGSSAARPAESPAAIPGSLSLRLGPNPERNPGSRRLSRASRRPGGAASEAASQQGGPDELCIALEPRGQPSCLLLLRGAQLRQPDPELVDGIASVARMLTAFLERLHLLAESRENEAAYRRKSAELEALYASLPVGISIHDPGGIVRYVNPYLAELEARGGSPASHALKRLYAEELPAWVARVLELDEPVHDVELFVVDGERTWSWLCNFAPIRDGEGRVLGASAVVHDISEIKRVEANLREADHQKDDFLAILGHELRNPIAALRSATDLLGRGEPPTPQLRRLHGIFERQTQQATKLIDGLLDVARVARGKVELDLAPVPLVQIVRQVLEDREQQLGGRSLERRLPENELWVLGDRARLVQVLDNLLSNALKFTGPNGHIGVTIARFGRRGSTRVEDDGAGIEPELLPHIFEPFRQGGTRAARHAGLGLGLALVKGLIDLHGFELRATSRGKGLGTCFEIEFPLAAEPDAPAPASRVDARALELLLVEDNVDIAETLAELLGADGHRVRWVETAEQALPALREQQPDVVLCDIGLPGMSGFELARQVLADPALAGVKLVAMTGYGDAGAREQMARAGFDRILIKPVQLGALRHCLERVAVAAPPSNPEAAV